MEWVSGMSVGIDEIDNEHKILIAIVAELSDAIDSDNPHEIILEIFERLEIYVKKHFSREEELMASLNYSRLDPHKKQHQNFTKKISEFKAMLMANYSVSIAEEVNLFLFNWLTNHILIEDMRFSLPAHEHGLSNYQTKKLTGLKRLAAWLGSEVPLRKRILLTSLLPIGGILLLGGFMLLSGYQQLNNMKFLLAQNEVMQTVNTLTHSLQAERGLSVGYIGSNHQRYFSELATQRMRSDRYIAQFDQAIDSRYDSSQDDISLYVGQLRTQLFKLKQQRHDIDQKSSSSHEPQLFYTQLITALLNLPNTTSPLKLRSDVTLSMAAYTLVLHLNEAGGKQRLLGVEVIESGRFTPQQHDDFSRLIGEQSGILHSIEQLLTVQQKQQWLPLYKGEAEEAVQAYQSKIYQAVTGEQLTNLNSLQWFGVMSTKLNQLKLLADELFLGVERDVEHNIQTLKTRLNYSALGLFFILVFTSFSSWLLTYSIISPVDRITKAMKRLAQGFRDFRFTNKFAKDELGEMVDAYETCRINLLRADIAETLHSRRQDFNLKIKIQEREHFRTLASIDPLTGVLNRREFNKRAQYELDMAWRYGRPFSLMMIDLDHFKKVNDVYGHAGGDIILKAFSATCLSCAREIDVVARLGGEEFAILMPETNAKQAYELAERIRVEVGRLEVSVNEDKAGVTVSIGIVAWSKRHKKEIDNVLADADSALYQAKNLGRNRSVIFEED